MAQAAQGCVAPLSGRPQEASGNRRPRWMTIPALRGTELGLQATSLAHHRAACHRFVVAPSDSCPAGPHGGDPHASSLYDRPAPAFSPSALSRPPSRRRTEADRLDLPNGWRAGGHHHRRHQPVRRFACRWRDLAGRPAHRRGRVLVARRRGPSWPAGARCLTAGLWAAGAPPARCEPTTRLPASCSRPSLRGRLPQRRRGHGGRRLRHRLVRAAGARHPARRGRRAAGARDCHGAAASAVTSSTARASTSTASWPPPAGLVVVHSGTGELYRVDPATRRGRRASTAAMST